MIVFSIYTYGYICNIIKQNSPEMEDFITFCLSCPFQPGHIDSWHNIDLQNKSCFRSLILNAFLYTWRFVVMLYFTGAVWGVPAQMQNNGLQGSMNWAALCKCHDMQIPSLTK